MSKNHSLNIGLFTDTYFPQINGVATSVHLLQKELTAQGHNVYIFTTTDPRAKREPDIFRMPSMPLVFLPSHRVGLIYSPKALLKIRKLKLDVVHTHSEFSLGIFGKIVSESKNIPLVHTYHTLWEDYVHYVAGGHIITPKMARRFSRFFCNRARVVIAPTEKAENYLHNYGVERPIRVIPTGIDFAPFAPQSHSSQDIADLKQSLGIPQNDHIMLSLGRIAKEKSMDVIINQMPKILEMLPNTRLIIVGDGPAKVELGQLAKSLNISANVMFTGARPWSEIGKYYQLGDVFVNASLTETQGLTYVEAMAAGLPVIAKFDTSIEKLVRNNETGYTFHDDNDLPQLVVNALTNKVERERITATALSSIHHLSSQKYGQNVAKLYQEVISAYPGSSKSSRFVRLKTRRR
ncbi:MAG: glycosyltransferase family 4 protein [Defluviitaleaceae bacterium]|nr:glycosyltransferase family 4 protein [Defluviitaleaceae bacterium]